MTKKPSENVSVNEIESAPNSLPVTRRNDEVDKWREKFELVSDENFALKAENAHLKSNHETSKLLNELIEPYAKKAFVFMCVYCGFVAMTLVLSGFKFAGFSLPDSVLDFLVGSTAVTVIGLVGMVLTGVFVGARKT